MNINNEALQKLIKGSRNIDRMKEEIKLVVDGIIEFCNDSNEAEARFEKEFETNNYRWIINALPHTDRFKCEWAIRCFPKGKDFPDMSIYQHRPNAKIWHSVKLENVQVVYQQLGEFVCFMTSQFPIERKLECFIKANEVFKD
jgi:hypothetical protein